MPKRKCVEISIDDAVRLAGTIGPVMERSVWEHRAPLKLHGNVKVKPYRVKRKDLEVNFDLIHAFLKALT